MFKWLFKKKKTITIIIKPKYKVNDTCFWNGRIVGINDYVIDGDTIKYIVVDLDTHIIYEWINENELYNAIIG